MATQRYDIPNNVILLAPRNPPAAVVIEIWSHFQYSFLRLPRQPVHSIAQAFVDQMITDFKDLTTFTPAAIADLTHKPDPALPAVLIPRGMIGRIMSAIAMFNDYSRQMGGDVDLRSITSDDYDNYRTNYYNPMNPLGQRYVPGANPNVARPTAAQLFDRGIKKDKDHYMEFKDEKIFDKFRRNVESTAHTHGTHDVLDPAFVPDPNDPEAVGLFRSKQNFMYTVFEKILLTDKSA
jgi:hypothetical protein